MTATPSVIELPEEMDKFVALDMRKEMDAKTAFSSIKQYIDKIADYKTVSDPKVILPLGGILRHYIWSMEESEGVYDFSELESVVNNFLKARAVAAKRTTPLPFNLVRTLRTRLLPGKEFDFAAAQNENIAIAALDVDSITMEVYNIVVDAYTRNSIRRRYKEESIKTIERLDLGGFFNPERSNKQRARELIHAAIEYITSDDSLSDTAKQSIIHNLEKVISELDKSEADWTEIFGKLKETIFILGAVGSLIGGVVALSPLLQAKQQLEEATKVIEETSIDLNYKTIRTLLNQDKSFTVTPEAFILEEPKSNKPLPLPHAPETDVENSSEIDVEDE